MKTPAFIFAGILAVASLASAIPNPAAEFCVKCGYKSEIRTDPQGGQYGVCVFPDGSECDEWDYFRKCNAPQTCEGDCNCPWPCPKRIIYVDDDGPADFNNIQAAIDDANNGDTVIVQPGRYTGQGNRDIDFKGKAITVRSTDPNDPNTVATTIIDCNGTEADRHRGFKFVSGEDQNSVLAGLTIVKGYAPVELLGDFPAIDVSAGGAIFCRNSSPTITLCFISDNLAKNPSWYPGDFTGWGGGIFCWYASPKVSRCIVYYNLAAEYGGGIYFESSSATITDSNISHNFSRYGGGIECDGYYEYCTVKIMRCNILANSAQVWGGGISCDGPRSNPTIDNCIISGNSSLQRGGGIFCVNIFGSALRMTPTVSNCIISGNSCFGWGGGGIYCYNRGADPTIINCIITGNSARGGGGVNCLDGSPTIRNSIISANLATEAGGGIYCYGDASKSVISNCTITGNLATLRGGGIYSKTGGSPRINNSVLWANISLVGSQIALWTNLYDTYLTISYSDIQAGRSAAYVGTDCELVWAQGNIDADPCFIDPGHWEDPCNTPTNPWDNVLIGGDYHLKSQAGRWDVNEGGWTKDEVTSLCIDAGDPASPIGLEPFPNGGIINMGAYGGTVEASKSYFGEPVCETIIAGDINGDCIVDFKDFALMAFHWLDER
jgi:parallel beta-helix repeat protein